MCDADTKIIAVCCRFGGSASSAYIWNKMHIRPFIESISRQGEMSWLIGLLFFPFLITAVSNELNVSW